MLPPKEPRNSEGKAPAEPEANANSPREAPAKSDPSGLRPLTPEDMALVKGNYVTDPPPPGGGPGPGIRPGNPAGPGNPVVVVANPPSPPPAPPPAPPPFPSPGPGMDPGGNPPSPPPPPPPQGCPPPVPSSSWAQNNPSVMSALRAHGKDIAGVNRAIANWNVIAAAANAHGIDPALLAAVGMRETDFEDINEIGGGNGRGVFQIDIGKNPSVTEAQANDINFAANFAANLLASNMSIIEQKNPNFVPEYIEQATAASYNLGPTTFSGDPSKIDQGSAGNDYGSNVVAIKGAFKDPVTGLTPKAGTSNGGKDGC